MSTPVTSHTQRNNLSVIFHYGKECLLNRWKLLLNITFFLIFLPRLLSSLVFSQSAKTYVDHIKSGALSSGNLIQTWENLVATDLQRGTAASMISLILILLGVLALARASVDYFEQRPSSVATSLQAAARALFLKGFGAAIMLVFVLLPSSVLALLRVVVLCLLVMLPLELVAGHKGGMRSVLDVLFLKYAVKGPLGKWPVFSNVMTVGGLSLSIMFLLQLMLVYMLDADVAFGFKSDWWVEQISIFGGTISRSHLIFRILELFFDAGVIALAMPFVASLRFFSQQGTFRAEA